MFSDEILFKPSWFYFFIVVKHCFKILFLYVCAVKDEAGVCDSSREHYPLINLFKLQRKLKSCQLLCKKILAHANNYKFTCIRYF